MGRTIGFVAGVVLTMLSAVLVSVSEGLRAAAFSLVGRGLSPGEASITYWFFQRTTFIHYVSLAVAVGALLVLHRFTTPGEWSGPVSPGGRGKGSVPASPGREGDHPHLAGRGGGSPVIRRVSGAAVAAGGLVMVFSLAGPGVLSQGRAFAIANYAMVLVLVARLWFTAVAIVPFPRERFVPALRRGEIYPGLFCALAAFLACAILYLRGTGVPAGEFIELSAVQLRACQVYAYLMTAANTFILAFFLLSALGLIGLVLPRLGAGTTAHVLAGCFAVAGLAGLVLSQTLSYSAAREIDLLELGTVLRLKAVMLTLLLTVLLFFSLRILEAYYPDQLSAIPSPLPLMVLPLAFLPVIWAAPLVAWADRRHRFRRMRLGTDMSEATTSWGWMVLNALALAGLVLIGYAALFGIMFNPWYTVYSTLKGFMVTYLCLCSAAMLVYYVYLFARRPVVSSIPVRALTGATLFLGALLPFAALHRDVEVKHALTQYSELAKVQLDLVKSATGLGNLLHAGDRPHQAPGYHPCPQPWRLTRNGDRLLPEKLSYIFICVDALRGDVFGRLGNSRKDITPFFDRWTAEECVFFERAISQGNGTFNSLPVLMGGRGDRRDLVPGVHEENAFYKLMVSEGIDRRCSFEGHGIRQLYPPDDPQFVSLGVPYYPGFSNHDHSVRAADCFERVKKAVSDLAKDRTFFIYVHLMDVHNDLYLKGEAHNYGGRDLDLYANNVNYLDRCMGEFIGWLKARSRYDKTVVIVTADHGEGFGEHQGSMHGHSFYEEDIHVPLMVRLPGLGARTIRTAVTTSDLTPTLIDLAGYRMAPPYDDGGVGISIRDLILDENQCRARFEKRELFLHSCFTEKYGLLRNGRYKFIYWVTYESYALFDLQEDPQERRNLINTHRDLASDMKRALLAELGHIRGIEYAARLPWEPG